MEHLFLQLNEAYTGIHVSGLMLFIIIVLHNLVIDIKYLTRMGVISSTFP